MDVKNERARVEQAELETAMPKLSLSKETVMNLTIRSNIRAGLRTSTRASGGDVCCG